MNQIYNKLPAEVDSTGFGQNTKFAACALRLAGHDLMDFRVHKDGSMTGGSDGCLNMEDPDNKGLPKCIQEFGLAKAYEDTCDRVSLADFIVIAAEAVTGRTATSYNKEDYFAEGTLARAHRDNFKHGRKTNVNCD